MLLLGFVLGLLFSSWIFVLVWLNVVMLVICWGFLISSSEMSIVLLVFMVLMVVVILDGDRVCICLVSFVLYVIGSVFKLCSRSCFGAFVVLIMVVLVAIVSCIVMRLILLVVPCISIVLFVWMLVVIRVCMVVVLVSMSLVVLV